MMTVARLHELFESHPDKAMLGFEGQCHHCGKDVNVAVALAPEGFAISGGAVYEPEPDKFHNKCDDCRRRARTYPTTAGVKFTVAWSDT